MFFIMKSFVEHLMSEALLAYQMDSDFRTEVNTSISTASPEGGHYHLVKIELSIVMITENNALAYRLTMAYSAVVGVENENLTDDEMHKILHSDIPQQLFDNIRAVVWQITRESGFPLMLKDDTFSRSVHVDNTDQFINPSEPTSDMEFEQDGFDDKDDFGEDDFASDEYSMSFRSVVKEINSFEEGAEFLKTLSRALNTNVLDFDSFDQLPVFQTYYRFITPIPYHCPEIDDCDPELWPMLFRLLFGNVNSKCKVIDGKKDVPELKFSYGKYNDYLVSELDSDDLNDLLSDLMTEALCEISVQLLHRSTKASESELKWSVGQLITKEQFYKLHNFFPGTAQEEDRVYFEMLYSKIKECDIQTYLYRL